MISAAPIRPALGTLLELRSCPACHNTTSRVLTGAPIDILARLLTLLPELELRFPGPMGERDLAKRLRMMADAIRETHQRCLAERRVA